MIYYNSNIINDWNFGDDNIIKVYRNNAVCYYKASSTSPTAQTPCFAVVDDISLYTDTEFEDVYDKTTEKWYKLNNLNAYEEYGIYGSGRTICTGSTPTPRLPDGYTEVEYIENTSQAYIDTGFKPNQDTRIILTAQTVTSQSSGKFIGAGSYNQTNAIQFTYEPSSVGSLQVSWGTVAGWTSYSSCIGDYDVHVYDWNKNEFYRDDTLVGSVTYANFQCTYNLGIFCHIDAYSASEAAYFKGKMFGLKIYDNDTLVRDFVPAKRDSDSKYGLYDVVNDVFYLSPNNNNFIGGNPIDYNCITVYEGKLTIDDGYEYIYSGNSWVNVGEVSGSTASLPNVPFSVNYNAKNYDSSTKTLLKTSGQLVDVDAVITAGTPTVHDGYLTIASGTRATISGYQTYFNRNASNPNLTIISKQTTSGSYCHMFANRDSNFNWMYRPTNTKLNFHGSSQIAGTNTTTQPVIESVRVNSNRLLTFNNYTDNTSSTKTGFKYGGTNSGKFAIFAGYGTNTSEWFVGDFYWVYMSQNTLTDEQVQQVITYNEGGGGEPIYPIEYTVKQDPPNNVTFTSMTEAESYECPWVGMTGIISNTDYLFCNTYTWLTKYAYEEVSGYLCESGNKYKKLQEYDRQLDGTMSATTTYVKGDLIEAHSSDCPQCTVNFCGTDANGNTVTVNNGTTTLSSSNWTSPYPVNGEVGAATTTIEMYCFRNISGTLSALTIGNTVTTIEHEAFMETSLLTTLTIPSSVTQIDFWAFTRCNGLTEVIFEGTTPPTFTNKNSGVFHDYCPSVIYVPDEAVSAYRAIDGTVWTNQSWSTDIIQPISNR